MLCIHVLLTTTLSKDTLGVLTYRVVPTTDVVFYGAVLGPGATV